MAEPARDLSLGRTLAFSATSLPLAAVVLAISIHLPAYFATSLGMPLAAVGVGFALCRLIDIPVEPMLGLAMDRTRTRLGRYRVWHIVGAPLLMLGLYMLGEADQAMGQPYLVIWLLVMYLGMSSLLLSHSAWAATLATSYESRARIFGVMAGAGVFGALGVLAVPIVMERLGYSDAEGVRGMLWYLILLTPITVGIVTILTPERIAPEPPGAAFRLRDYVELITHGSMARILIGDICLTLGPGWMAALFLFFSRDRMLFTTGQSNILLGVYILAGLFGAPAMGWAGARLGKHRMAMVACIVYCVALVSLIFQPPGALLAAVPVNFVAGFVGGGFVVLVRSMVADVADDIRLRQGKDRGGLLYSLTTSTAKIASVAGTAITFPVLEEIGYRPALGHANSPEAIHGLTIAFLAGPIFFLGAGALCFVGYKLTAERAADIRRQLELRDAALADEQALAGLGADTGVLTIPRGA